MTAPPPPGAREARPALRRFWLVVGTVVAVATVAYGALLVASLISRGERTRSDRFPAEGITAVDVRIGGGAIRVTGADTDAIRVRAEITEGVFGMRYRAERREGRIQVRADCPPILGIWCSADLTIEVPRGMPLGLHSNNGSISLEGTEGPALVSSDNGDIRLTAVTGKLEVDTDNGTVTGERLGTPSLRAHSDNGDFRLGFTAAPDRIDVTTDNGDVDMGLPDGAYALEVKTDNGSVRTPIRTDPGSSRSIRVHTDNGDVTLRYVGSR
jgi:hypothetical protein